MHASSTCKRCSSRDPSKQFDNGRGRDHGCERKYVSKPSNAHAHAHASFISTTTKPLPDSATNTNYDTLTMTAFTTTPICNLRHPWADVGLLCLLPASLGTRARMALKGAKQASSKKQAWLRFYGMYVCLYVCMSLPSYMLPRQVVPDVVGSKKWHRNHLYAIFIHPWRETGDQRGYSAPKFLLVNCAISLSNPARKEINSSSLSSVSILALVPLNWLLPTAFEYAALLLRLPRVSSHTRTCDFAFKGDFLEESLFIDSRPLVASRKNDVGALVWCSFSSVGNLYVFEALCEYAAVEAWSSDLHVCVCMYVCVCVCVCGCGCLYLYIYIYIYMYVCMYMYVHTTYNTYIRMYMRASQRYIHTSTRDMMTRNANHEQALQIVLCMDVCVCVYVFVFVCVYTYIHTYIHTYIYIYIYIYTHIHT